MSDEIGQDIKNALTDPDVAATALRIQRNLKREFGGKGLSEDELLARFAVTLAVMQHEAIDGMREMFADIVKIRAEVDRTD